MPDDDVPVYTVEELWRELFRDVRWTLKVYPGPPEPDDRGRRVLDFTTFAASTDAPSQWSEVVSGDD